MIKYNLRPWTGGVVIPRGKQNLGCFAFNNCHKWSILILGRRFSVRITQHSLLWYPRRYTLFPKDRYTTLSTFDNDLCSNPPFALRFNPSSFRPSRGWGNYLVSGPVTAIQRSTRENTGSEIICRFWNYMPNIDWVCLIVTGKGGASTHRRGVLFRYAACRIKSRGSGSLEQVPSTDLISHIELGFRGCRILYMMDLCFVSKFEGVSNNEARQSWDLRHRCSPLNFCLCDPALSRSHSLAPDAESTLFHIKRSGFISIHWQDISWANLHQSKSI